MAKDRKSQKPAPELRTAGIRILLTKELEARLRERARRELRTISTMAMILIEKGLREDK